jgi:hypothetical protein
MRLAWNAQQAFQMVGMAFGAFDLIAVGDERFEGVRAFLASIFVHWHGTIP